MVCVHLLCAQVRCVPCVAAMEPMQLNGRWGKINIKHWKQTQNSTVVLTIPCITVDGAAAGKLRLTSEVTNTSLWLQFLNLGIPFHSPKLDSYSH